jgi:hypothetical protein
LHGAGGLVVLAFALASVFCLRGAGSLVCLCFRWHPRFAFVAQPVWFACVFAGIRVMPSWRGRFGLPVFALASAFCLRASSVAPVLLPLRWHPRYDLPLHALPLCGAAPTFLCRRKEK